MTRFLHFSAGFLLLSGFQCLAYDIQIADKDYSRQACSGMWGGQSAYINVTFESTSQGQLAMVIYEWTDSQYLGKVTSETDDTIPQKTYVCTSTAVVGGFCSREDLGRFILDLPSGKAVNETSFWSARVDLSHENTTRKDTVSTSNISPRIAGRAFSSDTLSWSRETTHRLASRQDSAGSPSGIYHYQEPIHYPVKKTGYYCVAIVPVTLQSSVRQVADGPFHATYSGNILFKNTFDGKLPATDYPKVNFYFCMFLVYLALGAAWGWLCHKHVNELLPIQYYLSSLVGLLIIEMVANWAYYRYLNAHGKGTAATIFLIVVAILDAGRNSLSFFMLLVVSLGLSVVRENLGRTMTKCQILAGAHFIFGILYAVGIVELELESTSALVLLIFVIPLAFTLSGFLLWIMYSLSATISQLRARKQRYKLRMFERLNKILIMIVIVVMIFFVVSSMSFSGRLAEDYAAKSWRYRWWLLDGWLALLYLVAFAAIAYLWRPSENNRRYMSDEIAQDEEDAEDYDLEALQHRSRVRDEDDDDAATLVGERRGAETLREDAVVFEIGDEDVGSDDEDGNSKKRRLERQSGENHDEGERQGLIGNGHPRHRND